jgi:hypothetical protein
MRVWETTDHAPECDIALSASSELLFVDAAATRDRNAECIASATRSRELLFDGCGPLIRDRPVALGGCLAVP